MKIIRTYLDSSVLIKWENSEYSKEIDALIYTGKRTFYSSLFLEMETLPFLIHGKRENELEFLNLYFRNARNIPFSQTDIKQAFEIQKKYGVMGTVDSIHLSLCHKAGIDEFITLERESRTIYDFNHARSTKVIHLQMTGDR